jgi:zinc protease
MTRIGSSTNGSTSRDRTNYFEVVPVDGLEKALWAEADKLGFFINTVTEDVVAKEKQVVKNEKRQGVDNRPYGHASYVIDKALYPDGHPYQWQVIGSLADLDAASLADVKEFHTRWYGPNNATLVIAGDIDVEQVEGWIQKYFGEIPSRPLPETPAVPEVTLEEPVLLMHEDNYARLPQLQMAWPTVPRFDGDSYALDVLARLLTDGKNTPFERVVVEEDGVAPAVGAYNAAQQLAGRFTLTVRAFADTDLDEVRASVERAFTRFEEEGVRPEELARVKAGTERSFYQGLGSALGKAFALADYSIFAGDPGYLDEDLEATLSVTAEDVMRVYERYLADRPFVAASFVPRGRAELALDGSTVAAVEEEPIVMGAEPEVIIDDRENIERTPSIFDRSVEPPYGDPPTLSAPAVWRAELDNGLGLLGIVDDELPLVQFELRVPGGLLADDPDRVGVANLLAESMTAGTAGRTPAELEEAIDLLGASIDVASGRESFVVRGSTLARNYEATMALVEEILLEPRFDSTEFELAKRRVRNALRQQASNPGSIASRVYAGLVYGDHILAANPLGTEASVEAIGIDDLRAFYDETVRPAGGAFHIVGPVERDRVEASLDGLVQRWQGRGPELPGAPSWDPARAGLYFVDVPGASQSVLNIGYLALAETDDDFWPATVMNFRFGGGGFASDLTQELREGKGYTYGIRSGFSGSTRPGPFTISSGVRSNITFEALALIREIMEGYGPGFDSVDLDATRGFLLRTNARAFETQGAKLGLLADMSSYGFPADYLLEREAVVRDFTERRVRELAERYLDPGRMVWLVVGDAETQLPRLTELGLGEPTLLDREGERVR